MTEASDAGVERRGAYYHKLVVYYLLLNDARGLDTTTVERRCERNATQTCEHEELREEALEIVAALSSRQTPETEDEGCAVASDSQVSLPRDIDEEEASSWSDEGVMEPQTTAKSVCDSSVPPMPIDPTIDVQQAAVEEFFDKDPTAMISRMPLVSVLQSATRVELASLGCSLLDPLVAVDSETVSRTPLSSGPPHGSPDSVLWKASAELRESNEGMAGLTFGGFQTLPSIEEAAAGNHTPPLICAIIRRDRTTVESLLKCMEEMDTTTFLMMWSDVDQCTALHYACLVDDIDILDAVLKLCAKRFGNCHAEEWPSEDSSAGVAASAKRKASSDHFPFRSREFSGFESVGVDRSSRRAVHITPPTFGMIPRAIDQDNRELGASLSAAVRSAHAPLHNRHFASSAGRSFPAHLEQSTSRDEQQPDEDEKGFGLKSILDATAPMLVVSDTPTIMSSMHTFKSDWLSGEATSPHVVIGFSGTDLMSQGTLYGDHENTHKIESVFFTHFAVGLDPPLLPVVKDPIAFIASQGQRQQGDPMLARRHKWADPDQEESTVTYYYEVLLQSSGMFQIGWASDSTAPDATQGDGVGDTEDSWAYDGYRCQFWTDSHPRELSAEKKYLWKAGDVVGCILQAQQDTALATCDTHLIFTLNGVIQHEEFSLVPYCYDAFQSKFTRAGKETELWTVCPAMSMENFQQCHVNFGQEEFLFAPRHLPNFTPVAAVPLGHSHLLSTLQKTPPLCSSPAAWAVARGSLPALQALLAMDPHLQERSSTFAGSSLIELAAHSNQVEALDMLLRNCPCSGVIVPSRDGPANTVLLNQLHGLAGRRHATALARRGQIRSRSLNQRSARSPAMAWLRVAVSRAFLRAAATGAVQAVMLLHQPPAPAPAADVHFMENGWSALHYASLFGHVEVVQYLLDEADADIQSVNVHGSTAIHLAAYGGHADVLELLLHHIQQCIAPEPVDSSFARAAAAVMATMVDAKDSAKATAAMLAVRQDALECTKLLMGRFPLKLDLKRFFNEEHSRSTTSSGLFFTETERSTPFRRLMAVAMECGGPEMFEYLREVFSLTIDDIFELELLSLGTNTRLLAHMIRVCRDIDASTHSANVSYCVRTVQNNSVVWISGERNRCGNESLSDEGEDGQDSSDEEKKAAKKENISFLEQLVSAKNADYCLLDVAVLYLNEACVRLLLDFGADVNSCVRVTPLISSILAGSSFFAKLLSERGASMEGLDEEEMDVLCRAAFHGKPHVLSTVIAHGAPLRTGRLADGTERAPLLYHCIKEGRAYRNCVFVLCSKWPQLVDQESRRHGFPLLRSCKEGLDDFTAFLLDRGASPNLIASTGMTALRVASQCGGVEAVRMLLHHNAIVDLDFQGTTTLHQAVLCNRNLLEVIEILLEALRYQVEYPTPECSGRTVREAINSVGNSRKRTALHLLCANRSTSHSDKLKALRLFRAAGADLVPLDDHGDAPWHWACRYSNFKLAEELYDVTAERWPHEFGIGQRPPGEVVLVGSSRETIAEWFSNASELVHQYPPLDRRSVALPKKAKVTREFVGTVPRLARTLGRRDIVQVACGSNHFIALTASGTALSWGDGSSGQLGTGYKRFLRTPTAIDPARHGGHPVIQVACGGSHSLLLTSTKSLFACGSGQHGQLGSRPLSPSEASDQAFPRLVHGIQSQEIVQVAAGNSFSVALTKCAHVFFWGSMVGGPQMRFAPMLVRQLVEQAVICRIAAGRHHILAFTNTGETYSWGRNNFGQLGHGTSSHGRPGPVQGLEGVQSMAGGAFHSAAVTTKGELFAWGSNAHGQLGPAMDVLPQRHEAALVPTPYPVKTVTCGSRYTAAVGVAGQLLVLSNHMASPTQDTSAPLGTTVIPQGVIDVAAGDEMLLALVHREKEAHSTFSEFVANEEHSDLTIVTSDSVRIPAHKALLAARSDAFRTVLTATPQPGAEGSLWPPSRNSGSEVSVLKVISSEEVCVDDEFAHVLPLVHWMYSGSWARQGEQVPPPLHKAVRLLAHFLGIDFEAKLFDQISYHLDDIASFSDVTLVAGDGASLECHRVVLAARSTYFRALLSGGMKESVLDAVRLPSVQHSTLAAVVTYLYTGRLECKDDEWVALLIAADQMDIVELKWEAENVIISAIDNDNILPLHRLATTHGAYNLKEQCERFREKTLIAGRVAAEPLEGEEDNTDFLAELALLQKLARIREVCEDGGTTEDEDGDDYDEGYDAVPATEVEQLLLDGEGSDGEMDVDV